LWLLSGFIFIITLVSYQNNFAEDGEFTTEKTFSTADYQTISLDANKIKGGNYKQFDINVESYPGTEVRLLQTFGAEGNSEEDAIEHARSISYRAVQKDSAITLDNGFTLRPNALYRDQHLTVTLQLPETKNYRISQDLARLLPASAFNENYSNAQIARHTWQLRNNLFSCLTCTAQDTIELNRRNNRGLDHDRNGAGFLRDESDFGTDTRAIPARNFKKISVVGPFYVKIVTAENIAVEARGEMDDLNKIKYEVENGELKIYPRRSGLNFGNKMEPVHLSISLPELTQLTLVGATTAELSGFEGGSLKLKQTGATKCYLKADLRRLDVNLTGASEAILVGKADFLDANLVGGCQLKAGEFSVATADIDVVGGSEADVYVTRRLKADVSSGSELTYRGNPAETDIDQSSGGEARKNRQHSN
ncbi:MAG TPA: head GIN domain-containing protein, partial [Adhaeribacter sp.]|nr:head GIN domain-containing protein [Adhaeribacter sp.]